MTYKDFLEITINLFNGCISHLRVKNDFKGKVDGIVGIGDGMRKYYQANLGSFGEFVDGVFFYWIDDKYGLSFFIGDNFDDSPDEEEFENYLNMPILEIEIFDDKQRIGIGADLPKEWETKN
jgi:hypothetical protein